MHTRILGCSENPSSTSFSLCEQNISYKEEMHATSCNTPLHKTSCTGCACPGIALVLARKPVVPTKAKLHKGKRDDCLSDGPCGRRQRPGIHLLPLLGAG